MKIHYRVSGEGIEIVRCFGTDSQVVIPEQIEGKPVIKAAPYAFSARKDKEEIDVQTYDTDQIGQRSAEEKLLAGDAVEEVVFPDTMREIGRYIFYGCRNLKKLEFSDNLMQIGSGAFTVCGNLQKLIVHLQFGSKSCVKEILGELWQRMDVTFVYKTEHLAVRKRSWYSRGIMKKQWRIRQPGFCIPSIMVRETITGSVFWQRSWITRNMMNCFLWQW